jgi:hypothetical protein
METGKTSLSLNTEPFLSEEVERMLRLRAWKDEIFREALIADPKGVIQRLFPRSFPNGKLPEELTLKVIEEDPGTCHIVLPPLLDEVPTPEIPEEEQLELVANMGSAEGMLRRRDSSENKGESQLPEKPRQFDLLKSGCKKQETEQAAKKQEIANEPSTREQLLKEIGSLAKKDEAFRLSLLENARKALQDYFPHYFNGSNGSEKQTIKVSQDTAETRHLVLPSSRDDFEGGGVPKEPEGRAQLDHCCVTCICYSNSKD